MNPGTDTPSPPIQSRRASHSRRGCAHRHGLRHPGRKTVVIGFGTLLLCLAPVGGATACSSKQEVRTPAQQTTSGAGVAGTTSGAPTTTAVPPTTGAPAATTTQPPAGPTVPDGYQVQPDPSGADLPDGRWVALINMVDPVNETVMADVVELFLGDAARREWGVDNGQSGDNLAGDVYTRNTDPLNLRELPVTGDADLRLVPAAGGDPQTVSRRDFFQTLTKKDTGYAVTDTSLYLFTLTGGRVTALRQLPFEAS